MCKDIKVALVFHFISAKLCMFKFSVIALKTLNTTLQGQLEMAQKDSAALKGQVEVLTQEVERLHKQREELTQSLKLKVRYNLAYSG